MFSERPVCPFTMIYSDIILDPYSGLRTEQSIRPDIMTDTKEMPEIYAHNLTYIHYGLDKDAEAALVDISFSLPKGSRTILVGANGGECHNQSLVLDPC